MGALAAKTDGWVGALIPNAVVGRNHSAECRLPWNLLCELHEPKGAESVRLGVATGLDGSTQPRAAMMASVICVVVAAPWAIARALPRSLSMS